MKCICRPDRYVRYIPCKYLMGLFRTFFYNYIPMIYYVYPKYTHSISRVYNYKKGTEQTHETAYAFHYHVYTMYIPCIYLHGSDIPVIHNEYSLYILHGLSLVHTMFIPCIYMIYPWYIYGRYNAYQV